MSHHLEVWLDCDLAEICRVGMLSHDRGQVRFQYDKAWLQSSLAFAIDPTLTLGEQPYFPQPEQGNFGIFLDSSPDRWGQTLMKRREAMQAKDEGRPAKTLYAWDFLTGVQDATRQGALRFRRPDTLQFLDSDLRAAPPVTSLRELEEIATQLTGKRIDDLNATEARDIVEMVAQVVDDWRSVASRHGITRADIEVTSAAFSAHQHFRSGHG